MEDQLQFSPHNGPKDPEAGAGRAHAHSLSPFQTEAHALLFWGLGKLGVPPEDDGCQPVLFSKRRMEEFGIGWSREGPGLRGCATKVRFVIMVP